MKEALNISNLAMAGFYLTLLIPVCYCYLNKLRMNRDILISMGRMTLQLLLVGFYLNVVFAYQNIYLNFAWLAVMLFVASFSICNRVELPKKIAVPCVLSGFIIALIVLLPAILIGVVRATPWWQAQYLIPIGGMLLGNGLRANVVGLERWFSQLRETPEEYEYYLSLGTKKPLLPITQKAIRAALGPQLINMSTMGIVSLPGMMTGQILGGSDPLLAVKYQIIIAVAIFVAGFTSVAVSLATASRLVFDEYGRLKI